MVHRPESVAQSHGYTLGIANTDSSAAREAAALYNLAAERVAGVIVSSPGQATEDLERLAHAGIPFDALDRRIEDLVVDTVTTDGDKRRGVLLRSDQIVRDHEIAVAGALQSGPMAFDELDGLEMPDFDFLEIRQAATVIATVAATVLSLSRLAHGLPSLIGFAPSVLGQLVPGRTRSRVVDPQNVLI
jgi:hypothetical protein